MNKPKIGQRLYSLNVGNRARNTTQQLTPVVVVTVGRKYFTTLPVGKTDLFFEDRYHIDTWAEKTDTCTNSVLYLTEQSWADEQESRQLCVQISKAFMYGKNQHNVSLEYLREIADHIEWFSTNKTKSP